MSCMPNGLCATPHIDITQQNHRAPSQTFRQRQALRVKDGDFRKVVAIPARRILNVDVVTRICAAGLAASNSEIRHRSPQPLFADLVC